MPFISLSISVVPTNIKQETIAPYDIIILGFPFCNLYKDNPVSNLNLLKTSVETLKDYGKKIYITTPATPLTEEIDPILKLLDTAVSLGVEGVEIFNYGILNIVLENNYNLDILTGSFLNVYTKVTAVKLSNLGVKRIVPNCELSLNEITDIQMDLPIPIELPVHGKFPIAISRECFLSEIKKESCRHFCLEPKELLYGNTKTITMGTVLFSGKSLCLLEHIVLGKIKKFDYFRIYSYCESLDYVKTIGEIYKKAITENNLTHEWLQDSLFCIEQFNQNGFCNGYYFSKAGSEYIGELT